MTGTDDASYSLACTRIPMGIAGIEVAERWSQGQSFRHITIGLLRLREPMVERCVSRSSASQLLAGCRDDDSEAGRNTAAQ